MGVGRKKIGDNLTKNQRYYAKNKEKLLSQTKQRRQMKPWEQAFYRMERACKESEIKEYTFKNEFAKESFEIFYSTNSKGFKQPVIHRLDSKENFSAKNCVIIERKWANFLTGKAVDVQLKMIAGFKKETNKDVA